MQDEIKLTPEVNVSTEVLYLVRIDGEELAFVRSAREAKLVIDSIAASEIKRMEDEWTKVFRRDQKDGMMVAISTQSLGRVVNGRVSTAMKIDAVVVPCARLLRGRHQLAQSDEDAVKNEIPVPPPLPSEEVMQKLSLRRQSVGYPKEIEDDSDVETDSDSE